MVSTEGSEVVGVLHRSRGDGCTAAANATGKTKSFQKAKHRRIQKRSVGIRGEGEGSGTKKIQRVSRESEEELLEWIKERRESSVPVTMNQVIQAARLLFGLQVGQAWYFGFVKRHPEVQPNYWWKMQS